MRLPIRAVLACSLLGTLAACAESHRGRCVSARCRSASSAPDSSHAEPTTNEDADAESDETAPDASDERDASPATMPAPEGGAPAPDAGDAGLRATFAPTGPARGWFAGLAASPNAVLAATGVGVQRSLDDGDSWAPVDAPDLYDCTALATRGSEFFVACAKGVYRSTDDAATWQQVPVPRSPIATAGSANFAVQGADVFLTRNGAAYRLDPTTAAFQLLPTALGGAAFNSLGLSGSMLYAATSLNRGVFSFDLAAPNPAWTRIPELGIPEHLALAFLGGVGLAAGSSSVYRSDAPGWTALPTTLDGTSDLLADGTTFYAATRAGLLQSSDSGASWASLVSAPFSAHAALASDGANLYAAASDGIWRRRGEGAWQALPFAADEVWSLIASPGALLAISASGPLRWSNGSWERVPGDPLGQLAEFGPPDRRAFSASIVAHAGELLANRSNEVVASSDGGRTFARRSDISVAFLASTSLGVIALQQRPTRLVLSKDAGRSWEPLLPSENDPSFLDSFGSEAALAEVPGALILTSGYIDGTYRSSDQGKTWTKLALAQGIERVHSLVSAGDVILGCDQSGYAVRSTDQGQTWVRSGLDARPISSLIGWRTFVFAGVGAKNGAQGGVYVSADQGATWQPLDPTFTLRVGALALLGDTLYAGTLDASVWAARLE